MYMSHIWNIQWYFNKTKVPAVINELICQSLIFLCIFNIRVQRYSTRVNENTLIIIVVCQMVWKKTPRKNQQQWKWIALHTIHFIYYWLKVAFVFHLEMLASNFNPKYYNMQTDMGHDLIFNVFTTRKQLRSEYSRCSKIWNAQHFI